MNKKIVYKESFSVIGRAGHGSADNPGEWIAPLWQAANANFAEISSIVRKDDVGTPLVWGAMNDADEQNKRWGKIGKYMAGCEADVDAIPPEGWEKWIIPAQTYLVAECTTDQYGEVFGTITSDPNIQIIATVHERYPQPDNPSVLELWFPVAYDDKFCHFCGGVDMSGTIIDWLLDDDNPAVKYRTQTEILGQPADKTPVLEWLNAFLPTDWAAKTGLWFRYYITSFAECGLSCTDIPLDKETIIGFGNAFPFEHSCADYMHLRALVKLGLADEPMVAEIIRHLPERQLPDGGFLCLHRVDKLKRIPKSCVKANMYALLFCAECKKHGTSTEIEQPLLDYFWNHKLFYRTDNPDVLILNAREGWRTIDTFYPFEVMRVGLQNIVEAFCALGYGNDGRLSVAWSLLKNQTDAEGKVILNGTLTKSYLPKERCGKPGKWATFYTVLAQKERAAQN